MAVPLALLARRSPTIESVVVGGTTIIYTIPSLALFSLLLPFTGLSPTTVIIGLALYSLTILVRNVLAGLLAGARTRWSSPRAEWATPTPRLLTRVELPLALPVIMAGLRVATVSTVALVDDRRDRVLRRPRQPAAPGRRQPVQGADLRGQPAVRRAGRGPRPLLVVAQRLLTPWTRHAR